MLQRRWPALVLYNTDASLLTKKLRKNDFNFFLNSLIDVATKKNIILNLANFPDLRQKKFKILPLKRKNNPFYHLNEFEFVEKLIKIFIRKDNFFSFTK
jgi:hypothetical protein